MKLGIAQHGIGHLRDLQYVGENIQGEQRPSS